METSGLEETHETYLSFVSELVEILRAINTDACKFQNEINEHVLKLREDRDKLTPAEVEEWEELKEKPSKRYEMLENLVDTLLSAEEKTAERIWNKAKRFQGGDAGKASFIPMPTINSSFICRSSIRLFDASSESSRRVYRIQDETVLWPVDFQRSIRVGGFTGFGVSLGLYYGFPLLLPSS